MKLLSKINRTYLRYGILVFLVADIVIIQVSNHILKGELDQQLRLEAETIAETIQNEKTFISVYPTDIATEIKYSQINKESSKDTMIHDVIQNELIPFRELRTYKSINGKHYEIIIRQMLMEFNDIFTLYTVLITTILGLIFAGMLLFTRKMNSAIWNTFNKNVDILKSYSFDSNKKMILKSTDIDEFDDLNKVIIKMSKRLEKDYRASKEFSANAAHELQTPLAIIRSKCENLFSNPDLNEETIESLREIYVSTDRLSGATKALLLLAKVDYGQFRDTERVSLNEIFKTRLEFIKEILQDRELEVEIEETSIFTLNMDKRLANLLIQNLVTNAINHSPKGKSINIRLSDKEFCISNFGEYAIQEPYLIFNRFYRENQNSKSTGIGLAIVKKISDHYGMKIQYSFKSFKHTFTFCVNDC